MRVLGSVTQRSIPLLAACFLSFACGGDESSSPDAGPSRLDAALPELPACDGDFALSGNDSLVALAGCGQVNGNVELSDMQREEIVLLGLREIRGSLVIESSPLLQMIDLPLLQKVGGETHFTSLRLAELNAPMLTSTAELKIYDALRSMNMKALQSAGAVLSFRDSHLQKIELPALEHIPEEDVVLDSNGRLTAVDLGALTAPSGAAFELDWLSINHNQVLPDVSFPRLGRVRRALHIRDNAALGRVDLAGLQTVERSTAGAFVDVLVINGNPMLEELDLHDLQVVDWHATIEENGLTELLLPSAQSLFDLRVSDNPKLQTMSSPSFASCFMFTITDNTSLDSLSLPQLGDCSLRIDRNASLHAVDLPGLHDAILVHVGENQGLTTVRAPQLTDASRLIVRENPALAGFQLGVLTDVSQELRFVDNPALSTCSIATLVSQLSGAPGTKEISGNAGDCPAP
jgi:hypothetical protein